MTALPETLTKPLETLAADIEKAAGGALTALAVYGDAVRGEGFDISSEVNLLLVLESASFQTLKAVSEPLVRGWREQRARPYIIKSEELPRLTDVFPVTMLDIRNHHMMLRGKDVAELINIDDEHLRLRVEQELRNRLIRMRWRSITALGNRRELIRALHELGHSLRAELEALLFLKKVYEPGFDHARVFAEMGKAFALDATALSELEAISLGRLPGATEDAVDHVLILLEQLVTAVDALEVKG